MDAETLHTEDEQSSLLDQEYETLLWEAYEYEPKERSADWYWIVGIIALAICVVSLIYGNIIFAILVFFCFFVFLLFVARDF